MKRFLVACLIIASATWANAFNYAVPGAGISPGDDVIFGSGVFNLTATDSVYINASTFHHTDTDGALRTDLIPDVDSVRAIQTNINANGHNDIMAHSVDYIADGMSGTDQGMALEVNVTDGTATGGNVTGLWVTDDTTTGVDVTAVHAGANVAPITQLSGVAVAANTAFTYYSTFANVTSAFNNVGTNIPIFSEYSSFVYFGHTAAFSQVTFTLATSANTSILPDHEFWNGSAWADFGPNDTTGGLTSSGHWSWKADALVTAGWVANTVNSISQFYTRARRTAPTLTTVPTESKVEIVTGATYGWNSTGDVAAATLTTSGAVSLGGDISWPSSAGNYVASIVNGVADGVVSIGPGTISTGNKTGVTVGGYNIVSSGVHKVFGITPTHNQSGTAGATDLAIERNPTSVGSGEQNYLKATGGTGDFRVDDTGSVFADGNLRLGGGVSYSNITTVFSNYSVDINDKYVFINASSAARVLSMPDATTKKGAEIRFKKIDDLFNTVTFDGYGTQTIDGDLELIISYPGNALTLLSDGANWQTTQKTGEALIFSSYQFASVAAGTYYDGGGFYHGDTVDANLTQAASSYLHGVANEPAGAHAFWVFGAFASAPDGTVFLNISGTSIADSGVAANEEITLIPDMSALSLNDYVESTQKWLGQVKYKLGCTGTCTTYSADGNTGHAKYADFQDRDFTLRAIEVTGQGGAADTGFSLCIKHHDHAGWTYAATGFVPGNGDLACLGTDYGANDDLSSGGLISWDRDLNTFVSGSTDQGVVVEIVTTQPNAVRSLNIKYGIVYK